MNRCLLLDWDKQHQVVVKMPRESAVQDVIVVERLDVATRETVATELNAPFTYGINGLLRASTKHLLIGIRNSVICFDVERMEEVCRARQCDGGAPLEEDALEEECLSPGGFDFDPLRRHLFMLNGYYDEAALSCYELTPDYKKFRRLYRREVCGHCPRGMGDLLAAGGICRLPDSDHIVAIFTLENVWVPLGAGQVFQGPARLCWVAEFAENRDTWIEVVRPFDGDFMGDLDPILGGQNWGVQFASAEDWTPQPVAIDNRRIAFATKTGKILVTNLENSYTTCVAEFNCDISALSFRTDEQQLLVETTHGTRIPHHLAVVATGLSSKGLEQKSATEREPVTRISRQPHKPKRHRPKALPVPEVNVLSWSCGDPVAITPDGKFAIAGRYVIDLTDMQTVCVLPRHSEPIREVSISSDARRVLTNDGFVRVYDGRSGKLLSKLTSARQFSLSPCERFAALVDFNELTIWNLRTGETQHRLSSGGSCVSWSPNGKHIAFGGWQGGTIRKPDGPGLMRLNDDSISIMELETSFLVGTLKPGSLKRICWTRHGLLIRLEDKVENWDPATVTKNGEFLVSDGKWIVAPDHSFLVTAQSYGGMKRANHIVASITSLPEGKLLAEVVQSLGGVTDVSIGVANDQLLVSSDRLRLLRPHDGQWIADVGSEWGRNPVTHLSPASPRLATRSWKYMEGHEPTDNVVDEPLSIEESIRVWDLSQTQACIFAASFRSVLSASERTIVISADGQRVVVPTQQAVWVWKVGDAETVARIDCECDSSSLTALSHGGELLAICIGNEIRLFDVGSQLEVNRLRSHSQRICAMSISEDSDWLVSGSTERTVKLWDLRQPDREPRTFSGAEKGIVAVGYMSELGCVLASSEDKIIRVWGASSGQLLHLLDGPSGQICQQILTLDSKRFAAKYGDQVWIWNIANAQPELCMKSDWCQWVGSNCAGQLITSRNSEFQRWVR